MRRGDCRSRSPAPRKSKPESQHIPDALCSPLACRRLPRAPSHGHWGPIAASGRCRLGHHNGQKLQFEVAARGPVWCNGRPLAVCAGLRGLGIRLARVKRAQRHDATGGSRGSSKVKEWGVACRPKTWRRPDPPRRWRHGSGAREISAGRGGGQRRDRAHRDAQSEDQRAHHLRVRRCAEGGEGGGRRDHARRRGRPLARRCPIAMKDLLRLQAGLGHDLRRRPRPQGLRRRLLLRASPSAWSRPGAILVGKTNSPVLGFRGTCDNYLFGPSTQSLRPRRRTPAAPPAAAPAPSPTGCCRSAEGTDGGGSIRIPASWCGVYGYKPSFGRVPARGRAERLRRYRAVPLRRPDHAAPWRTPPWRCRRSPGYDSARPLQPRRQRRLHGRRCAARSAAGRSPTRRDYGIFPVDPRVIAVVVTRRSRPSSEAGARVEEVKIGIRRSQQRAERRLVPLHLPLDAGRARSKACSARASISCRTIATTCRRRSWHWDEIGQEADGRQFPPRPGRCAARCSMPLRGVLDRYDLLVSPTLAPASRVEQRDGPQHRRTDRRSTAEAIDPLIGWCMPPDQLDTRLSGRDRSGGGWRTNAADANYRGQHGSDGQRWQLRRRRRRWHRPASSDMPASERSFSGGAGCASHACRWGGILQRR